MTVPTLPETFARLRAEKKRAFLPFLVAGYPSYEESMELALAVAKHADILELGLPFSDPIADGPLIQQASAQARTVFSTWYPPPPVARIGLLNRRRWWMIST